MVEGDNKDRNRARLIERSDRVVFCALIGSYEGDISEAPGLKGKIDVLAEVPRYRLFHGKVDDCYLMISQGSGMVDPKRVIITFFGAREDRVLSAVDKLLEESGIQESKDGEEVQTLMQKARQLAILGVLPSWLDPTSSANN